MLYIFYFLGAPPLFIGLGLHGLHCLPPHYIIISVWRPSSIFHVYFIMHVWYVSSVDVSWTSLAALKYVSELHRPVDVERIYCISFLSGSAISLAFCNITIQQYPIRSNWSSLRNTIICLKLLTLFRNSLSVKQRPLGFVGQVIGYDHSKVTLSWGWCVGSAVAVGGIVWVRRKGGGLKRHSMSLFGYGT